MAQTVILEEQALSFQENASYGCYGSFADNITLIAGEMYRVVWDGAEHQFLAVNYESAGAIGIGNAGILGVGEDTGETFCIGCSDGTLFLFSTDEADAHTVAIYRVEAGAETPPSATVKIKGYSGAEHTYENVPKVWLAAPESTAESPVLVPFTYGEALDNVEVVPDFSAGDQKVTMPAGFMARSAVVKKPETLVPGNIKAGETVAGVTGDYDPEPETEEKTLAADFSTGDMVLEPTAGKYLLRATVEKPETLIPENIAEGVNIAGIIGTLKTSGGNLLVNSGVYTIDTPIDEGVSSSIEHGMGRAPDFFIVCAINTNITTGMMVSMIGYNDTASPIARVYNNKQSFYQYYRGGEIVYGGHAPGTFMADDEKINLYSSFSYPRGKYLWIAICDQT